MLSGDGVARVTETADAVSGHAAGLTIESAFLERVVAALEEQVEVLGRIQTVGASNADRRALLVRCEAVSRSLFGLSHTWIADLLAQNGLEVIEGPAKQSLATLLNLSPTRAGQRLRLSEQFGERTAVAGERLDPVLPRTAAAADDGVLDEEHHHHIDEWADGGGTDIESLTFGCDVHHRLVGPRERDWATTKAGSGHRYAGRTLWHPPVTLDPARRGRVNHFHHPNEYIYPAENGPNPTSEKGP